MKQISLHSDALLFFVATGDLAYIPRIFHALHTVSTDDAYVKSYGFDPATAHSR
jgi:hypothetical protein